MSIKTVVDGRGTVSYTSEGPATFAVTIPTTMTRLDYPLSASLASGSQTVPTKSQVVLMVDATSGSVTMTLPSANDYPGMTAIIKKKDNTAHAVTIQPSGSQTIDTMSSISLTAAMASVQLYSFQSNWWIL